MFESSLCNTKGDDDSRKDGSIEKYGPKSVLKKFSLNFIIYS